MRSAIGIVADNNRTGPRRGPESYSSYISCLRPLVVGSYFELYPLALGQRLKTFSGNRRIVNENVRSIVLLDKPISLGFVEPLHRSFKRHSRQTLLITALRLLTRKQSLGECGQLIRTPLRVISFQVQAPLQVPYPALVQRRQAL